MFATAKSLIERGWCQGNMAQNSAGRVVNVFSPTACKWCLVGAIYKASVEEGFLLEDAVNIIRRVTGIDDLAAYNDRPETTVQDILSILEKADAG